ncbi:COG3127 Predicted ABC-type transport system involved in lysophospholipase L1 biosynthesis, permease component [Oxalobacteraceae bacterium]
MRVASEALRTLGHALRMTRRDWRAGELRFLLAALAVAVAALSAVGFFVDRMNAALERDATELLGADLLVRSDYPLRDAWRAEALARGLTSADVVSFPSMATTGRAETEDTRLVAVKAVSSAYPLRGDLRLRTKNTELTTKGAPQAGTVWVDTALLSLRGLHLGDAMTLGERRFTIAAEILLEKDRGAGFMNFAPRVMLALQDLESTGLVQNGSRITYRLQLAGNSSDIAAFQRWLENEIKVNEVRGVQLESLESGRPEMRTTLERARQFLSLVSLLTAMLAALAIAMASRRFMQRHLDAVAMLRCLGLRQNEVTLIYLIEFILIGTIGSLIGAAIGFAAHFLLLEWLGALMTTRLPPPGWMPLVQGVATGLLLLLGFAIPPVLQLRNVPHNRVIRREQDPPKAFTISGYLLALASFMGLLLWQARDLRLGLLTFGGFIALLAVSFMAGWMLLRMVQSVRVPPGWPAWRFAQTSLKRRPAATILQIVALSLGLMALLLLTVVRQDLVAAWRQSSPPDAPNHFIINIQPDQREAVAQELTKNGIADVGLDPMIRGRLLQVDGRNISSATYTEERAQRLVEREFNLSTLTELPAHNTITEGRWFDNAQPEASVEQGLAKTLGLKLGDLLRFDVGGQSVDLKITSLRKLDWGSMRVNFFVILNPSAAQNLPATYITAFHLPATQQSLVNQLVRHYPNLTIVDVGSMVVQVQQVIDQVIAAVEFLFLFTLVSGVMVLAAAMLISQNERAHEAGLLRALGATRRELSRAQWVECLLVGAAAGVLAASGASLVGWVLAHQVFEFEWQFSPLVWIVGIAAGIACAFLGGWFGLRNVLSRPPIQTLREA